MSKVDTTDMVQEVVHRDSGPVHYWVPRRNPAETARLVALRDSLGKKKTYTYTSARGDFVITAHSTVEAATLGREALDRGYLL